MNIMKNKLLFKKLFLSSCSGIVLTFLTSACSLDAQILMTPSLLPGTALPGTGDIAPITASQRSEPDFISGETVTTGDGVIFTGVFGEISEKQTLENGIVLEGVFYD